MSKQRLTYLLFTLLLSSSFLKAQTDLYPGDIILLSMTSNMGLCGFPDKTDRFSFACFEDITTGTSFDVTDNGWETQSPGHWGDGEGTLNIVRTGGTLPRGTVITIESRLVAGSWTYKAISPDNLWSISDVNVPGGGFNIDDGGEQLYFMAGGTWNNHGGSANKADYEGGRIIYAANNHATWAANGSVNESNLHPDVLPCYYMQPSSGGGYTDGMEYAGPVDSANIFTWIERIQSPFFWNTFEDCVDQNAWNPPNWNTPQTIPIYNDMALRCPFACFVCPPIDYNMYLYLPDGKYNVVITNGVDTFTVFDAENFDAVTVHVTESVNYRILSVEEVGGCKVYSHFYAQANITAPYTNAGVHTEIYICPTYGVYNLFSYLQGNPTAGGMWSPPLSDFSAFEVYYSSWGPGTYIYFFTHGHDCPPDTASVTVHFIDVDETTIEVGCSQNGTPNNIFDDRTVVTLNVAGTEFGSGYTITSSSGSITPSSGLTGVPVQFTLGAGTAIGPNVVLTIQGTDVPYCKFEFPITSPGFCSDPCDYEMEASISGPEDICLLNCPENPGFIAVEVSGGTAPYTMDFELYSPGHPIWQFDNIPITSFYEINVCVDSVAAPVYNPATHYLTLPVFLGESDITMTMINVFDKYGCSAILDDNEVFTNIHKLPSVDTLTLNLCRTESMNVDLTEFNEEINPFYDVTWYDGNPLAGGELLSHPTGTNLEDVVELWAKVVDDYCANAIRVPVNIFPSPQLDSIPPIAICAGGTIVLQSVPLNDTGMSMATYSYHAGLPPDSSNILDPLVYLPEASTTIYVLATTVHMCYDTLPIDIIVENYPGLVVDAQPCHVEEGTYSILFNSSATTIISSAGVVFNNPAGQDSISAIPNDVDVTIYVLNASGMCSDTFVIIAPVCNCPQINQPVPAAALYQLCEGQPLPLISVTVDPGMQANWFSEPSGGVAFLTNSLDYQPTEAVSTIYYVESLDPNTNCYSVRTAITLDIFPLAELAQLADPVICQSDPIDLAVFVPSVLNGVPGTGGWFDLITGQPLMGVQHPKDGKGWYYLFSSTNGGCESRDTVVVTANPLPVINDYSLMCNDELHTYDIFFITDADVVLSSAGTLVQIPGTDSVSIVSIPFGSDVEIHLEYSATGCTSTNFQQAPECSCPPLLNSTGFKECTTEGNVDLKDFQGPGAQGTWQIVSTPPGDNPGSIAGSTFQGENKDQGTYTLLFIRNVLIDNCIDSAYFDLHLAGSPDATFNFSQTENVVVLEYPGMDYDSLHWTFGDGRTDNTANPTVVYTELGQYQISLIVYNSCGTDTTSVGVAIITISTNNPSIPAADWQIRPNPFKDILTIYGEPQLDGTATISLLDVHGKLISSEEWIHSSGHVLKDIRADHLPSGVVLVMIQDQNSRVVLKAVHQK